MSLKIKRAFDKAGIPDMPMTRRHILDNLRKVEADLDKLSSTQIGYIIKALNIGYHDKKAGNEADYMKDMGCVWIGGDVQELYPIDMLKKIKKETCYEKDDKGLKHHKYTLNYIEKF